MLIHLHKWKYSAAHTHRETRARFVGVLYVLTHLTFTQKRGENGMKERGSDARINIVNQCMELYLKRNSGILACLHGIRIITTIDCWLPTSRPSQIIYFQCDYKWKHLNLICTICDHRHTHILAYTRWKYFASIVVLRWCAGEWKGVRDGRK